MERAINAIANGFMHPFSLYSNLFLPVFSKHVIFFWRILQAFLRDMVGLVPEHSNEAKYYSKAGHTVFSVPVSIEVMFMLYVVY